MKRAKRSVPLILWILFACANHVHSSCDSDSDCDMTDAVCLDSTCTCEGDYVANSYYTECLQVAHSYGDSCDDNLQCSTGFSTGGYCNDGACECLDGYHYFKGQCWKTSGLGDSCKKDENCFVSEDFEASVCNSSNICVCADGYYQREYSSCRIKRTSVGESCGITPDCQFDGGVCNTSRICAYNSSSSSVSSLKSSAQVGESREQSILILTEVSSSLETSCSTDSDCPTYATCTDEICVCDQGFYGDSDGCHPELGAACEEDSDCLGRNTECPSDKLYCVCQNGFVTSDDRRSCHKLSRHLGWSCLTDNWCSYFGPRAVCSTKKCACDSTSQYIDDVMFCWVKLDVGDECNADLDCGESGLATCSDGVCTCPSGYHSSSDNSTCQSDAELGEDCVEDVDCVSTNTECSSDTSTCVCESGYFESDGSCIPGITGSCNTSSDCIDGSSCVDSACACNDSLVASEDLDACLEEVDINENCTETAQCEHLDAECLDGLCLCPTGSHYVDGYSCFTSVELNETCSRNDECYVANSECEAYTCSCIYGYTAVDGECSGSISLFNSITSVTILFLLFVSKII